MNRSSSKISFDVQQRAIPKATEPKAADAPVDAAAEEVKKHLPLPPVFSTPEAKPNADVSPKEADKPKLKATNKPKVFQRPTPKPPLFAATGLMAQEQTGFFRRNIKPLGVAGGAALVLVVGLMTAFSPDEGGGAQSFSSAAASLPVQETPTRSVAVDLTDVSAQSDVPAQAALSQAVLAGLKPPVKQAAPVAEVAPKVKATTPQGGSKLGQLRQGILDNAYRVGVVENDGARRVELVMQNIDLTAGDIEGLLAEATQSDLLESSGALQTPEGDLDTQTMIFDVVQRSLLVDETHASSEAAVDMSRKVFAASVARTRFVNGQRLYTVQPGDSLAYIALQFFGMPGEYDRILEANRSTLQSPDKIQIGQRLIIPS